MFELYYVSTFFFYIKIIKFSCFFHKNRFAHPLRKFKLPNLYSIKPRDNCTCFEKVTGYTGGEISKNIHK